MKKSIIYLLIISFVGGVALSSCEDMLETDSERHSYETAQDTLYAYWGVLKSLQNIGERYVLLGELRGDLVMPGNLLDPDAEVSDSLLGIANFSNLEDGACRYLAARDYYAVINNCNAYIAAADTDRIVYGGTSNNSRYMLREYAQVEAIRAWVYLQLVELYGEVPFYLQPLTSTDAINDFISNPNHEVVNRNTLPEKIGPRLLPLIAKQENNELADPQYGKYVTTCHSSFCLFPLRLVMGDIYLNADRYEEAATQYHAWMRDDAYTAVPSRANNYAQAYDNSFLNQIDYVVDYDYTFIAEKSTGERGEDEKCEAITVIPGTTNKLWGNVLRGVNEAFGYTAEVRVSTTGTDTASVSGTVDLTPITYKRQFVASKEFKRVAADYPSMTINKSKQHGLSYGEIAYDYITTNGADPDTAKDGRYGWFAKTFAETANGNYGSDSCFISKQNPLGVFSTTYPVIYRRALVWLRFAEAINRAGYPEYAYAVLKDGCFGGVLPTESTAEVFVFEGALTCIRTVETIRTPQTDENGEALEDLVTYVSKCEVIEKGSEDAHTLIDNESVKQEFIYPEVVFTSDLDTYREFIEGGEEAQNLQIADSLSISLDVYKTYVDVTKTPELINSNKTPQMTAFDYTGEFTLTSGNYIPVNQLRAANYVPWLDFTSKNFNAATGNSRRLGIHQRGSGYIALSFCEDAFYNFDKCVAAKWPGKDAGNEFPGRLNFYAVDGGTYAEYQNNLIEAVEELIMDELALECCFEGNRYTDLVRFANRHHTGAKSAEEWLQDKINKRCSVPVTISNMYLKLPQ